MTIRMVHNNRNKDADTDRMLLNREVHYYLSLGI